MATVRSPTSQPVHDTSAPRRAKVVVRRSARRKGASNGSASGRTTSAADARAPISEPSSRATPSRSVRNSRCSGPMFVSTPISGSAIAQRSASSPTSLVPSSHTQSAWRGSSRRSVRGTPRRLLWLAWVARVGTWAPQSAARMSFVDVLPFEPATPITFPPHARRTWRASTPSAARGSSTSITATLPEGGAEPWRQSTAAAPAAIASARNACPSTRVPSSAQKSAPGRASRESVVTSSITRSPSPRVSGSSAARAETTSGITRAAALVRRHDRRTA